MKLSVTTIPWGKLNSLSQLERVMRFMRKVGFDGVGIETRFLPRDAMRRPEHIAALADKVGLEIAGSYSSMLRSDLEMAKASGTPLLWVVVTGRAFEEALRALDGFTRRASGMGIIVALHNHLRTCFEAEAQIAMALKSIKELKLCLDTAHAAAAGMDLLGLMQRYYNRVALVHLKDLRARLTKDKVRFAKDFVNVGSGIIRFEPIVEKLRDVDYKGHLMLEVEALEGEAPERAVNYGFEFMKRLLKQ